jgi:hypothetical protein
VIHLNLGLIDDSPGATVGRRIVRMSARGSKACLLVERFEMRYAKQFSPMIRSQSEFTDEGLGQTPG